MKLARHLANTTGPHLKTLREAGNVAWVLGEDSMAAGESVEPLQAEKVNKKVQSSESQSTLKSIRYFLGQLHQTPWQLRDSVTLDTQEAYLEELHFLESIVNEGRQNEMKMKWKRLLACERGKLHYNENRASMNKN